MAQQQTQQTQQKDKAVLAYSGGLDTSVCIKWLQEEKNLDVIAVVGDVGQEHEGLEKIDPRTRRKELFQRVGVQFQEARYQDKITVDELCRATRALYREADDPAKLLARFSLTEVRKQAVESLSGGQRQRLFVVLALIPRPEVVFLDELTTGLDVKARRDVWNLLDEMRQQGMTIVLTSHFMDEVEALCDRVIILRKGRIVFEGTVAEAVASGPFASFEDAYLAYAEPAEHAESVEAAEPAATAHFSEGGAHESL